MARIKINGAIVSNDDAWIYDMFDIEHACPKCIEQQINDANGEDLDIDINSGGGDVFSGSAIYSAIRAYKGNVNIHVTGIAASAASVIACAAHSDISPTAQLMVHCVSAYVDGNHNDLAKESADLQKADRAIAAAYTAKSGMSEKDALDLMENETWIPADDAVGYGLIDEIASNLNGACGGGDGSKKKKNAEPDRMAASVSGLLPPSVIDKMQNRKQQLIDYFA